MVQMQIEGRKLYTTMFCVWLLAALTVVRDSLLSTVCTHIEQLEVEYARISVMPAIHSPLDSVNRILCIFTQLLD